MPLNLTATKEEHELISKIVDAIIELPQCATRARMDWHMDIEAVHCNGCPLRLEDLLAASKDDARHCYDFVHDVAGIARHLNRETGELEDFFLPRFAAPASEREAATA